jgi:hypothetical protein
MSLYVCHDLKESITALFKTIPNTTVSVVCISVSPSGEVSHIKSVSFEPKAAGFSAFHERG